MKPKIGMICRMDNGGLGTLSWTFAEHLKPKKILLVSNGIFQTFPERYKEFETMQARPSHLFMDREKEWFTDDIDILFSIETFYDWSIISLCREKGIKVVLMPMIEMTPEQIPRYPDWFLCPSKLDYYYFANQKGHSSVYIPIPLDTSKLIWKERKKAHVFVHSASHGGQNNRKGTYLLLEAMRYVKADIKLIIYSWMPITVNDKRIEVKVQNFKNYWQVWEKGDVLVYPQDYNGICLPIIEAMACGLGVITTNIYPFNEYMPKELLFEPESMYKTRVQHGYVEMDAAKIKPQTIAAKIDEWAGLDISQFSHYGKEYAQEHSWDNLLPKYYDFFNSIV